MVGPSNLGPALCALLLFSALAKAMTCTTVLAASTAIWTMASVIFAHFISL